MSLLGKLEGGGGESRISEAAEYSSQNSKEIVRYFLYQKFLCDAMCHIT